MCSSIQVVLYTLLFPVAQNIDKGLLFAQSLKAKIGQASKQTRAVEKRIKRLSSTLSSTSELDSELLLGL